MVRLRQFGDVQDSWPPGARWSSLMHSSTPSTYRLESSVITLAATMLSIAALTLKGQVVGVAAASVRRPVLGNDANPPQVQDFHGACAPGGGVLELLCEPVPHHVVVSGVSGKVPAESRRQLDRPRAAWLAGTRDPLANRRARRSGPGSGGRCARAAYCRAMAARRGLGGRPSAGRGGRPGTGRL
jgi:hypothetical protein